MRRKFTTLLMSLLAVLVLISSNAMAQYPEISIYDLQYVADPVSDDLSPFLNDTVSVTGLVMNGPRDLWIGARWALYIVDPDSFPNPWSGFFVLQNDTFAVNTNFGFIEPGMVVKFTGTVSEFGNFSQVGQLTDPLTPVEILSVGNPLPDPLVLTAQDLDGRANGEQWESMFVRINGASIVNNNIAGNWASFTDASGSTGYLAEYFNWWRDRLQAGSISWPVNGSDLDLWGFVRDESGTPGQVYSVNPRDDMDLDVADCIPPTISSTQRLPGVPTSADAVSVSATIIDNANTISAAILHYSVDEGPFMQLNMTTSDSVYSASIPAQADGATVRYFYTTENSCGSSSGSPGDTTRASGQVFLYTVRDNGLIISDIQDTRGYAVDISPYDSYVVTVRGVVMTDSTDEIGDYWIQDAAAPWSGIWVNDDTFTHVKGDEIEVTGTVDEDFGVTRIESVTSSVVVNAGVGEFAPIDVTTGTVTTGGVGAESYESVLVRIPSAEVTGEFPDGFPGFGEFVVNDGTGDLRLDDFFDAYPGQGADTTYALGEFYDLTGFGYFSFGNYKIIPRDTLDVIPVDVSIDEDLAVPTEFELEQNYPNPFNPSTDIRYSIAKAGIYSLEIYNVLGQRIATLVSKQHAIGTHQINWAGFDSNGAQVGSGIYFYRLSGEGVAQTRKMILLK